MTAPPTDSEGTLNELPIVLGGNTFGWTSDRAASFAVLDAFAAAGGRLIDTADIYSAWVPGHVGGESERILGEWLTRRRDTGLPTPRVATKVGRHPDFTGLAPEVVLAAAAASSERLQIDVIDVYLAHYDDPTVPIEQTAAAFRQLQIEGTIIDVGLSNYSAARIREWIAVADREGWARPRYLQPHYNLVHRRPFESELRSVAVDLDLRVMPYFGLASGFLTGKYRTAADLAGASRQQFAGPYFSKEGLAVVDELDEIARSRGVEIATVALAWLRQQPGVHAPVVSARTVEQLPALLAAASLVLNPAELDRLDRLSSLVG
ncbi:aldo/keto reductase [Nakamurella sp. YIM 132087]|uniref:Aldo/keto reductase n=1 Tax=Nakamurella alba TaxID=2665158 RepID=A0A7K1FE66_9ACTN|nr:aldo/keto reductase [Nakamurella alba]MTD12402.1 aldo/keto reductase [Nakamurella alba]